MGYMRHHAIIVSSYDDDRIIKAREIAVDIGLPVTGVQVTQVNRHYTFVVTPDGSQEGWDHSIEFDDKRNRFVRWLRRQRFKDGSSPFNWVEVQYGDDDLDTKTIRSSDNDRSIITHFMYYPPLPDDS